MTTATLQALRPAVTFRAWQVMENGLAHPLGMIDAESHQEAADVLSQGRLRGTVFAILRHDAGRNTRTVGMYQVKHKAQPQKKFCTKSMRIVEVGKEYAVQLGPVFGVIDFAPREPFDAFRDCPVGRDMQIVGD